MIRKMYISAVLVVVVCLMMGSATYAIFTSSATNTGNSFAAGTIVLYQERDYGDSIPGPMFYSSSSDRTGYYPWDVPKDQYDVVGGEAIGGWAPGDTATRNMIVKNTGSLAAIVKTLRASVNSNGGGETSGTAFDEFTGKMNIQVLYSLATQNLTLYNGSLAGLLDGENIPGFRLAPNGGPANLTFIATLDKGAGNVIQGKTFVFDFTFSAEQEKNNP